MTIHDYSRWERTPALQRMSDGELASISPEQGWFIFCIVRNPIDRLWSAWQSKLLMREPHYRRWYSDKSWFPRVPADTAQIAHDFKGLISALEANPTLFGRDPHWLPQAEILKVDSFPYTHIAKIEQFADLLGALQRHLKANGWKGTLSPHRENRSLLPLDVAQLTSTDRRSIEKVYARDFESFAYPRSKHVRAHSAGGAVVGGDLLAAVRQIVERNERIGDLHQAAHRLTLNSPSWPKAVPSQRGMLTARPQPEVSIVVLAPDASSAAACIRAFGNIKNAEMVAVLQTAATERDERTGPGVRMIHAPNSSLARRIRAGIGAASGKIVVLCRDAIAIDPGWWPEFRACFDRQNVGIVGASLAHPGYAGATCYGATAVDDVLNCRWIMKQPAGRTASVPIVSTRFAAFRSGVMRQVGGIDAGLVGVGGEDLEMSIRLWRMGYECLVVPRITVLSDLTPRDEIEDRRGFLANRLRIAAVHFDERRLVQLVKALHADPLLPELLAETVAGDAQAQRTAVDSRSPHDLEAFMARCHDASLELLA